MNTVVEFFGLRRSIVGMGEHMAERFLPLYLQPLAAGTTAIFAIGVLAWRGGDVEVK